MFGAVEWVLDNPDVGWVVLILYLMWEIRGPKGAIHDLKLQIEKSGTIIRALARVHDDIETEQVDEYLNGTKEPNDFINPEDDDSSDPETLIKDTGDD